MLDVAGDTRLVEALRRGDEGVFMELIDRYQPSLLKVAMTYLGNPAPRAGAVHD